MKDIIQSKYARFFLAGLGLNILCAWFSAGFHHADEHFQVFEFCSYKMGNTSASVMPWEFQQKIRASLMPGMAYIGARFMIWAGIYNPFTLAFLFRLITGMTSWFIGCRYWILFSSKFKTKTGDRLFIFMAMFLWFVPYLSVRFTSENVSGLLILYGIYGILRNENKIFNSVIPFVLAGILLGISCYIRFQTIFAIGGFMAWLIWIRKTPVKYLFVTVISLLAAIGINILVDYWFYGVWVFTPYNYFYANIVLHKAADFGTSPWWFYFSDFIIRTVPPLSLVLLSMFFVGIYKNRKDAMVWISVPLVAAHLFISHKEMRFLFPLTFIFIYITSMGLDYLLTIENYRKIHKYVYLACTIISVPLLVFRTVIPANAAISYFKYIYDFVPAEKTIFISLDKEDYYAIYELQAGFYKKPGFQEIYVANMDEMNKYIQLNQPESALFLSKQYMPAIQEIQGYKVKLAYCYFPSWISKIDFNKWEERTQIWCIYEYDKL